MADEQIPSLLDYLKAKYNPFTQDEIKIPDSEDGEFNLPKPISLVKKEAPSLKVPYRTITGLFSAFIAQQSLTPSPNRSFIPALVFYVISITLLVLAGKKGELGTNKLQLMQFSSPIREIESYSKKQISRFPFAVLFGVITFLLFQPHIFNFLNMLFWILSIIFTIAIFWEGEIGFLKIKEKINLWVKNSDWKISRFQIIFIAIFLLGVWMRTSQINSIPQDMTSYHAEAINDVLGIFQGDQKVFFPRNRGREPMAIYIAAKMISQMGTENVFLSMKIGAALISSLTLIFVYLIGKEIANPRVGLISMGLIGIGYWPLAMARSAQGFETAPLFWSTVFFFLLRSFKLKNRNAFILCGVFTGIGLYSYAAFRIIPLVIFLIFLFAIIFSKKSVTKWHLLNGFLIVTIVAIVVSIPIIRFALDSPEVYGHQVLTRLTGLENPIEGSGIQIFLQNMWNALNMTTWNGGGVWTNSVPGMLSLDSVTGAFFHLGVIYLLIQLFLFKSRESLLLLGTIPLLLLPTALSIAFPVENPSMSRAGMAMIPIFIIAGLMIDKFWQVFEKQSSKVTRILSVGILFGLIVLSFAQNHYSVFNKFAKNYQSNSRNTSEIGAVVKSFINTTGTTETNYAINYPHWLDARLIMMTAGYPGKDNTLDISQIEETKLDSRMKLFLLHPEHTEALDLLTILFPEGWWQQYPSNVEKDFILFYAPAN